MSETHTHPQAYIEPGAVIAPSAIIEPYAVIKSGVTIGENVVVRSHAYIEGNVTIGPGSRVYSFATVGTRPQHYTDQGHNSRIIIGANTEIREYVSINAAVDGEGVIGDDCLLMAYCHVGHNCRIGNGVVMTNQAMLGGHVEIHDHARIGGLTAIHQFVRVGRYAMVGGMSRIIKDVMPFTIGTGLEYRLGGLNMIGLKRNGFPLAVRRQLAKAFRLQFRSGLRLEDAVREIQAQCEPIEEIQQWLDFCRHSLRGFETGQPRRSRRTPSQPELQGV